MALGRKSRIPLHQHMNRCRVRLYRRGPRGFPLGPLRRRPVRRRQPAVEPIEDPRPRPRKCCDPSLLGNGAIMRLRQHCAGHHFRRGRRPRNHARHNQHHYAETTRPYPRHAIPVVVVYTPPHSPRCGLNRRNGWLGPCVKRTPRSRIDPSRFYRRWRTEIIHRRRKEQARAPRNLLIINARSKPICDLTGTHTPRDAVSARRITLPNNPRCAVNS